MVNSSAAQRFWPGEDPLGKQISFDDTRMLTIVGILGDVRQRSLGVAPQPEIFLDYLQPGPDWPWLVLVVKTESEPAKLAGTLKAVAQSVDRDVPVLEVRTMDEVLSSSLAEPGVYALLLSLFASVALALAAVGLYGIVSFAVTQRIHEMGIRMALGAARGEIFRLVLRRGMTLAIAGTVIGVAGSLLATRVLVGAGTRGAAGRPIGAVGGNSVALGRCLCRQLPAGATFGPHRSYRGTAIRIAGAHRTLWSTPSTPGYRNLFLSCYLVFRFSLCRHFIRSAVLPADSLEPRDGLGTSRPEIQ